ncbi:MAG: hypothetical protein ACE5F6_02315 [Anaerolineae bacterium]
MPAARLPAPLYFLAGGQIHRLERDGVTLTQITDEPEPVIDFDVSLANGMVVYVSGNNLIRADAYGGDPVVLVAGPTQPDEYNRAIQIGSPREGGRQPGLCPLRPGVSQHVVLRDAHRGRERSGGPPADHEQL